VNLDDIIVDLKLRPETLEVPVLRYFKVRCLNRIIDIVRDKVMSIMGSGRVVVGIRTMCGGRCFCRFCVLGGLMRFVVARRMYSFCMRRQVTKSFRVPPSDY
jgi:hypothetical protein